VYRHFKMLAQTLKCSLPDARYSYEPFKCSYRQLKPVWSAGNAVGYWALNAGAPGLACSGAVIAVTRQWKCRSWKH
jgi:hypothetical protein